MCDLHEKRMRKYSSELFKTSIVGEFTMVSCGASCNKFLFSNENKLVTAWWPCSVNKIFSTLSFNSNLMEECMKMRKLLPQFFKPDALHRYVGVMDIIAQRHLVILIA